MTSPSPSSWRRGTVSIILILLLAALLRLWNLTASDVITDEGSLGFRAIGLIDFDAAQNQSTPWEWINTLPDWMRLSFHDHPPLFFWIQHLSIKIFGENTFALRFPSAIFGIASVWLLWLIAKLFVDKKFAYLAATLGAINTYLVLVSRIGLQESLVIFLMLLSIYLFLLAQKKPKMYLALGSALGLVFLTKYTSFILIPIFLTYLLVIDKKQFREKYFWYGTGIAIIIFSPVIIYNILLYKHFGHFDFQFSYLFGQKVQAWKIQPGKEEFSGIQDKFFHFFSNFINGAGIVFSSVFTLSFAFLLFAARKKKTPAIFLLASIAWLFLFYLLIGPTQRFLSLLIPFSILSIIYGFQSIVRHTIAKNATEKYTTNFHDRENLL